ncbi:hypothetical protein [Legionella parisiensis]|uniref:hypothetical protein n=1 Tax=Legionella parisiensis TaxID=45071 RepID=UPI000AA7A2F3|nr:hypothetical protein [Legionella parisiensis]
MNLKLRLIRLFLKNPKGQILEPGFRVIFPEADKLIKEKLVLNLACEVEEQDHE